MQPSVRWTVSCIVIVSATTASTGRAQTPLRLTDSTIRRIDSIFAGAVRPNTPGCAIAISSGRDQAYARGYGAADLEHGIPIGPGTPFNLASASKPFVAMAIMALVADGKIHLGDEVRQYLPELPEVTNGITIQHLLQHTSGLRDVRNLEQNYGALLGNALDVDQEMAIVLRQQHLNHPPGAAYSYTNTGFFLLLRLIERVTKEPFAVFLEQRITGPLGMAHTRYRGRPGELVPGRALGYDKAADSTYTRSFSATETVFSTAEDLVRWMGGLDQGQPIPRSTLEEMWHPVKLLTGGEYPYGMGFELMTYRALQVIFHSGGTTDGTSMLIYVPDIHLGVITLCNSPALDPFHFGFGVLSEVLKSSYADVVATKRREAAATAAASPAPVPPKSVPATPAVLHRAAGTYFADFGGPQLRRFRVTADTLRLVQDNGSLTPLIYLGGGRFQLNSQSVYAFAEPGAKGPPLTRFFPGDAPVPFDRVRDDPKVSAEYAGRFYSSENEAYIDFSVRSDTLFYRFQFDAVPTPLQTPFRDGFRDASGLYFRFTRSADGLPTAVRLHWSSLWRVDFTKVRR